MDLHPAADLHGPRLAVVCLAGVDFNGVDEEDNRGNDTDPDPATGEKNGWDEKGEKTEYICEDCAE